MDEGRFVLRRVGALLVAEAFDMLRGIFAALGGKPMVIQTPDEIFHRAAEQAAAQKAA